VIVRPTVDADVVRTIALARETGLPLAVRVATRFHFRLHEVDQVVGGMLVLPATAETVAGFVAAAEAAPDELTTIANVLNCPPMPLTGMYPPEDPDHHPTAVSKTMFVESIGLNEAALLIERLQSSDARLRAAQLRVLGGAVARVPADATAYAHRKQRIMVNVAAFYDGPADRVARTEWVDGVVAALRQGDDAAYVNFLMDEGPERVRAAYPGATWDRLVTVKSTYDPENFFSRNQNVPPSW
jgi:Berberine and berberine like